MESDVHHGYIINVYSTTRRKGCKVVKLPHRKLNFILGLPCIHALLITKKRVELQKLPRQLMQCSRSCTIDMLQLKVSPDVQPLSFSCTYHDKFVCPSSSELSSSELVPEALESDSLGSNLYGPGIENLKY